MADEPPLPGRRPVAGQLMTDPPEAAPSAAATDTPFAAVLPYAGPRGCRGDWLMAGTSVPDRLLPLLGVLRRAYPHGVPERDYMPLLDLLQWRMSERSLAIIVAALIDGDPAVVAGNSAVLAAAPAGGGCRPGDVSRVRGRLDAKGWDEVSRSFEDKDVHARISPVPVQPDDPDSWMVEALAVLRRVYPEGIPGAEYRPLLAALHKEMSFRNIGALVGAFTGRNYVAIYFEAEGAASIAPDDRLPRGDIDRVWVKLLGNGWIPEFPLPRYEEPGFGEQAVTALRRAYPDGLADDDYLLLLAALDRDIDDYTTIAYIVSEAFPGRDAVTIWHDVQHFHDAGKASESLPPPAAAERSWQRLLSHGFPPSGGPTDPG
jgi:hypothetical protein